MKGELPDYTPERCTCILRDGFAFRWHGQRNDYPFAVYRCINDADPRYTFDKGQTMLCREHGEQREREDEALAQHEAEGTI